MNHCIEKLYPSTKFYFMLGVIVLSAVIPGYTFQYCVFPVVVILSILSGCFQGFIKIFFKSIFVIVLFIFAVQTFIISYGDEVPLFAFLHFSQIGLDTSLNSSD